MTSIVIREPMKVRVHHGRLVTVIHYEPSDDGWEFHETVEPDPNPMPRFKLWRRR